MPPGEVPAVVGRLLGERLELVEDLWLTVLRSECPPAQVDRLIRLKELSGPLNPPEISPSDEEAGFRSGDSEAIVRTAWLVTGMNRAARAMDVTSRPAHPMTTATTHRRPAGVMGASPLPAVGTRWSTVVISRAFPRGGRCDSTRPGDPDRFPSPDTAHV